MNKLLIFSVLVCALAGCAESTSPSSAKLPYDTNSTTVIGGSDEGMGDADEGLFGNVVTTPNGSTCLMVDDVCVTPQAQCGDDGTADVLLDEKGKPATIICYPPEDGIAIEDVEGSIDHVGNNVVLVIDDQADGVDVDGDVTIDGNNVILYGNGPDVSVIGGDLNIAKNNSVVRGVRVQGDVTITKNNGTLIDCVIEGDLTISANNVNIALCEVWGQLTIEGNNSVLVSNAFLSAPVVTGKPRACNHNVLFADTNDDGAFTKDEITGDVGCEASAGGGKK